MLLMLVSSPLYACAIHIQFSRYNKICTLGYVVIVIMLDSLGKTNLDRTKNRKVRFNINNIYLAPNKSYDASSCNSIKYTDILKRQKNKQNQFYETKVDNFPVTSALYIIVIEQKCYILWLNVLM